MYNCINMYKVCREILQVLEYAYINEREREKEILY